MVPRCALQSRPSVGSLDASRPWSLILTVEVTDTFMSPEVVKITGALLGVCPGSATQEVFGEECLVINSRLPLTGVLPCFLLSLLDSYASSMLD